METKQAIPVQDFISLRFGMGDLYAGTWFGIIENIVVDLVPETSFIE